MEGTKRRDQESNPHIPQTIKPKIAIMIQATPRSPMEQKIRSGSSFIGEQLLCEEEGTTQIKNRVTSSFA